MIAAGAFLDGADASFDFGNVLIFAGSIEGCIVAGGDVAAAALEFHIPVDLVDFETRLLEVCLVHVTNTFDKGRCCAIGERLSGDEMNITGEHEEANFVDEHVVNARCDHAVFVGDTSQRKAERMS
jgi:hypothetical protein